MKRIYVQKVTCDACGYTIYLPLNTKAPEECQECKDREAYRLALNKCNNT